MPLILRFQLKGTQVKVLDDGVKRIKALKGKRLIICPNHPSPHDPHILFALSRLVGESFNYLAAREVFDFDNGMNGFWLQHLGCYSVVRGAVDRESFKTTKSLLVNGKKKLVLFPEGEISRQNDTVMPLESGVAQMAYWALDEIEKKGNAEPGTSIYILPLAVKYTYRENIRQALDEAMFALEIELNLPLHQNPSVSLYLRLTAIAERILSVMEDEYHFKEKEATMNARINHLRRFILQNIADFLKVDLPAKGSELDWVRILRNAIDEEIYEDEEEMSSYERKMHEEKQLKLRGFYKDLDRVVNFISIYDGYLKENMTQERFAEIIDRFEVEVFGQSKIKGKRLVLLSVGTPIDLRDYYPTYKQNKKEANAIISEEISQQLKAMLKKIEEERQRVYIN